MLPFYRWQYLGKARQLEWSLGLGLNTLCKKHVAFKSPNPVDSAQSLCLLLRSPRCQIYDCTDNQRVHGVLIYRTSDSLLCYKVIYLLGKGHYKVSIISTKIKTILTHFRNHNWLFWGELHGDFCKESQKASLWHSAWSKVVNKHQPNKRMNSATHDGISDALDFYPWQAM